MSNRNLYIILAIVVVVVVAGYLLYRQGKKSAERPKDVEYPNNGTGIPAGWSAEIIADNLHDVMDGLFTLPITKDAAWLKLRDLPTNDMVIAVYNVFNQKYFNKDDGTLTQWIKDESVLGWPSEVKETTLARLATLNLV